jgi:hypothetical protein
MSCCAVPASPFWPAIARPRDAIGHGEASRGSTDLRIAHGSARSRQVGDRRTGVTGYKCSRRLPSRSRPTPGRILSGLPGGHGVPECSCRLPSRSRPTATAVTTADSSCRSGTAARRYPTVAPGRHSGNAPMHRPPVGCLRAADLHRSAVSAGRTERPRRGVDPAGDQPDGVDRWMTRSLPVSPRRGRCARPELPRRIRA